MIATVTVREYARLTTESVATPSLDRAQVSVSAFDWLCKLAAKMIPSGASLLHVEDRHWLRLDNFVGVLETPCGTRLEILPKHSEQGDCVMKSRSLLQRMISVAMDLPVREVGETALHLFDAPLSEWVIARFLKALDHLIKRGVRSEYVRVEDGERFLRGQLNCVQQARQPPGRQHVFHIRHDVFVPDRPENRLLKRALEQVCRQTQHPGNWRLAQELRMLFQTIPASADIEGDFQQWRSDRLMVHYRAVKPWCELILSRQMPMSLLGLWHGISLLFPMEKLFERYVAAMLPNELVADARLAAQASGKSLCSHNAEPMFRLRPDLLIEHLGKCWVLDTKWKLLDAEDRANNYGLSQADFYQLFAYGQKFLGGQGELALIYPLRGVFQDPLPAFLFSTDLRLWVLPFDLDKGCLVHGGMTSLPIRRQKTVVGKSSSGESINPMVSAA